LNCLRLRPGELLAGPDTLSADGGTQMSRAPHLLVTGEQCAEADK
jgi:hypothetical protein